MSLSISVPLTSLPGVRLQYGADVELLNGLCNALGIPLPIDHLTVLQQSNGFEVYGGYFRLFGIGPKANLDAKIWNDSECWKFSWKNRCSDFWCFGETAWGDQYAYSIPALICGEAEIYFLDCLSMTATLIASSFSEFFDQEITRVAENPYDFMIKEARKAFGDLEIGEHLVYTPSPIFGAAEDISNIQKMDARVAMIYNGDIAIQLDSAPLDGSIKSISTYEDSFGRQRLKLNWH